MWRKGLKPCLKGGFSIVKRIGFQVKLPEIQGEFAFDFVWSYLDKTISIDNHHHYVN